MRTAFVECVSFLSSDAGFAETSSWPTTHSTVAVTGHRRSETFEDTITSCAFVVFVWNQNI